MTEHFFGIFCAIVYRYNLIRTILHSNTWYCFYNYYLLQNTNIKEKLKTHMATHGLGLRGKMHISCLFCCVLWSSCPITETSDEVSFAQCVPLFLNGSHPWSACHPLVYPHKLDAYSEGDVQVWKASLTRWPKPHHTQHTVVFRPL